MSLDIQKRIAAPPLLAEHPDLDLFIAMSIAVMHIINSKFVDLVDKLLQVAAPLDVGIRHEEYETEQQEVQPGLAQKALEGGRERTLRSRLLSSGCS